jgi:DNA-binding SARP family transcriptional activator
MVRRFETRKSLEQEVLRLYKRAVAERRWEIAEPLMCALERLAQADPAREAALELAYLCVAAADGGQGHRG